MAARRSTLWEKHRPDLLCLDIMMPQIDGYEVCRRVRAADPQVPVLFLSAKSEEIDVVVGLQLGADDFIRKPFGKHELLARIRAALRRVQARAANARAVSPARSRRLSARTARRARRRLHRSLAARSRHPRTPARARRPGRRSRHAAQPLLGPRLLPRVAHARPAHRQAAQAHRARSREPDDHRNRARRRLPFPRVMNDVAASG